MPTTFSMCFVYEFTYFMRWVLFLPLFFYTQGSRRAEKLYHWLQSSCGEKAAEVGLGPYPLDFEYLLLAINKCSQDPRWAVQCSCRRLFSLRHEKEGGIPFNK